MPPTRPTPSCRRRPASTSFFTIDESDRAARLMRIQTFAEETFGGQQKANRWLRHPLAELRGETPIDASQTEQGARVVETILGKIAWGSAA